MPGQQVGAIVKENGQPRMPGKSWRPAIPSNCRGQLEVDFRIGVVTSWCPAEDTEKTASVATVNPAMVCAGNRGVETPCRTGQAASVGVITQAVSAPSVPGPGTAQH